MKERVVLVMLAEGMEVFQKRDVGWKRVTRSCTSSREEIREQCVGPIEFRYESRQPLIGYTHCEKGHPSLA